MGDLTHINESNQPGMVDVSDKSETDRQAIAEAIVKLTPEIVAQFDGDDWQSKKGPVFQTAIIAGTMGAKKTSDLIPLCHPLPLTGCKISINLDRETLTARIVASARTRGRTGVEMEALTAASVAALTIYDMCKALSHNIEIQSIRLLEKTGGKSDYSQS